MNEKLQRLGSMRYGCGALYTDSPSALNFTIMFCKYVTYISVQRDIFPSNVPQLFDLARKKMCYIRPIVILSCYVQNRSEKRRSLLYALNFESSNHFNEAVFAEKRRCKRLTVFFLEFQQRPWTIKELCCISHNLRSTDPAAFVHLFLFVLLWDSSASPNMISESIT